ncbi:hypothetical protein UFOVP204_12 [uncultured Caudovirales phage]|uniref:Uncharacterized protein n=1 Tax=uncultured Caudovirales phage TaxID=2100421 RepID=A0A6J7WJZ1_9CAUD|nr:hypothetical protein UFOVP204_12 [uncultured Caudovirales phage]
MTKKLIKFKPGMPGLKKNSDTAPMPTSKTLPEWYRKADRFARDPRTGEFWENPDGSGKAPTWKACPAMFDIMTSGYVFVTPCDIEFYLDENEKIAVKVLDKQFEHFCTPREPMDQFTGPMNCYEEHFAWFPNWAPSLPEGYSAIYFAPINRFDLPFVMTSGIVDNDKIDLPGSVPFFINKGFTGLIKKGTPYLQILPFKREDWQSEVVQEDDRSLYARAMANSRFYRIKDGGVYKNKVWSKRSYD